MHAGLTVAATGLQFMVIFSGFLADLSKNESSQYTWYGLGSFFLIILFALIWGPLTGISSKREPDLHRKFLVLATYLSIQFVLYPIIWILGISGLGIINNFTTNLLYVIVPIFSKAGFGFLELSLLQKYIKRKSEAKEAFVTIFRL
jgi:bacteriorhodopsin